MDNFITVNTESGSYPIYIGASILQNLPDLYPAPTKNRKAILLTDSNVNTYYGSAVNNALDSAGWSIDDILVIPAGENSKSFKQFEEIANIILNRGIDRDTTIFALGGGVVGDLSGFLASILLRGIDFVQLPTSLLAQVDSSVGGKTGINTPIGKNLIGAFFQPKSVIIDIATLSSLPMRELKSGYAEVIKYGMIYDRSFWLWLQENGRKLLSGDVDAIKYAVLRSCEIKAEIVAKDEKEITGVRALLNFGHSFGHALEHEAGYGESLKHGEAVAIGMVMAAKLSEKIGLCSVGIADILQKHLHDMDIPVQPPFSITAENMLKAMCFDKKNKDGKIHLILLEDIGKAVVKSDVSTDELLLFLMETIKKWD